MNESDKGYLFVANPKDATLTPTEQQTTYGTIENCYTIVKAINDSVSSYVPNKTYKNEAGENVYPIYVESTRTIGSIIIINIIVRFCNFIFTSF